MFSTPQNIDKQNNDNNNQAIKILCTKYDDSFYKKIFPSTTKNTEENKK